MEDHFPSINNEGFGLQYQSISHNMFQWNAHQLADIKYCIVHLSNITFKCIWWYKSVNWCHEYRRPFHNSMISHDIYHFGCWTHNNIRHKYKKSHLCSSHEDIQHHNSSSKVFGPNVNILSNDNNLWLQHWHAYQNLTQPDKFQKFNVRVPINSPMCNSREIYRLGH